MDAIRCLDGDRCVRFSSLQKEKKKHIGTQYVQRKLVVIILSTSFVQTTETMFHNNTIRKSLLAHKKIIWNVLSSIEVD